jgi:uncharacterized protein GlcG (DUF336 family)
MLTVRRLSLEDAKTILEAAERKATEIGVPQDIAVVDESGYLLTFSRMDGAKFSAIEIAINKALTSAGGRRATREYKEVAGPNGPAFGLHTQLGGRFTIVGGGIPVVVDGQVVGAVGVSSGSAAQDHEVADAGIAAFLATL